MEELDKLNGERGTATNAMVLFLAINTSALAILPSGVVSMRASVGSEDAAGIFFPTWFASGCATLVGVTAAILLSRLAAYRRTEPGPAADAPPPGTGGDAGSTVDAPAALDPIPGRRWAGRLFWFAPRRACSDASSGSTGPTRPSRSSPPSRRPGCSRWWWRCS